MPTRYTEARRQLRDPNSAANQDFAKFFRALWAEYGHPFPAELEAQHPTTRTDPDTLGALKSELADFEKTTENEPFEAGN